VVSYVDTVSVLYGSVAKPGCAFYLGQEFCSKNIVGYYNVQGTVVGGITGQAVTMIGQNSGKRTGTILASCEDHLTLGGNPATYVYLRCVQRANYSAGPGDSGAPIFVPYNGTQQTPVIVGLHSASANGQSLITTINQIGYALQSAYYYQ
jgi:hypothetical protein